MQDEVRDKSVALAISVGKVGGRLTADMLKTAMRRYLSASKNPKTPHGKMSVKQLIQQDGSTKSMEVHDVKVRDFERVARKYGIDFAVKKQKGTDRYLLFFKAKDKGAIDAAFLEFTGGIITRKKDGQEKKPSLLKQLAHFKEVVKQAVQSKEKNRDKGEMSL